MDRPFDTDTSEFYRHHAQFAAAPPGLQVAAIVPNPVDADRWRYRYDKDDYLLFVARMHHTKGADRAITAARLAGVPLVLAGPVQPGQEHYFHTHVAPHVDGDRVRYVGEVGGSQRQELFAGARGLLMPIRWPEPFGLVMVEALASGTPVVAFAEGAATEIVRDGITGFLVSDEQEMAAAVARLSQLNPAECRADAVTRFSPAQVAAGYEQVYEHAIARGRTLPAIQIRATCGDDDRAPGRAIDTVSVAQGRLPHSDPVPHVLFTPGVGLSGTDPDHPVTAGTGTRHRQPNHPPHRPLAGTTR